MKQVVIIFGPPGSGKGTQSELLSEKLGLYYFETSKLLENKFKEVDGIDSKKRFIKFGGEKFDVLDEQVKWKRGELCSPPFVVELVMEEIKKLAKIGESLILSGSPRTVYEAERILPLLKKLYGKENIKAVLLKLSPEATILRNSNRKICELMRHPILYNEETKSLTFCPLDGSRLVRREGLDDIETIQTRLTEYQQRTMPVFDHFRENDIIPIEVKGEESVAEVFRNILKVIA